MITKSMLALNKFSSGYNCAQSVLYAFINDEILLDKNIGLKIASGFGAGMGREQKVCGAVSGGIMVLGLKYGRGEHDDRTATEVTYSKTQELITRFSTLHGSCICRKLLDGCDLKMETGQKEFKSKDLLNKTCKPCVESAVKILESILSIK